MSWERIDKYRLITGKTLTEVSQDLGVGKSMLMMVKSGRRALSSKAEFRLTAAEINAGVRPPPTTSAAPPECVMEDLPALGSAQKLNEICAKLDALLDRVDRLEKNINRRSPR